MSCTLQTTKKYQTRPGPPYKGNECCGEVRDGNNGLPYVSEKRGRAAYCRWFLVEDDEPEQPVQRKTVAKRGRVSTKKPTAGVKRARSRSRSRERPAKKAAVVKARRSRSRDRGSTWNEFRSQYKGQGYTMAELSAMYKSGSTTQTKKASAPAKKTQNKEPSQAYYVFEFSFPFEHDVTVAGAKTIEKELNSGENDLHYMDQKGPLKIVKDSGTMKHTANKTGVTTLVTFPKSIVTTLGAGPIADILNDYLYGQFHDGWGSQGFEYGKSKHVFVDIDAPVNMIGHTA